MLEGEILLFLKEYTDSVYVIFGDKEQHLSMTSCFQGIDLHISVDLGEKIMIYINNKNKYEEFDIKPCSIINIKKQLIPTFVEYNVLSKEEKKIKDIIE